MAFARTGRRVIVVIRQAATARAFLPVLEALGQGSVPPSIFAFDVASQMLGAWRSSAHRIRRFSDASPALDAIHDPGLLLTGSSEQVDDDAAFWRWARARQVPSVAFLDGWVHYAERFTSTAAAAAFDVTPDRIAVIDEMMAQRLVESGCDAGKLVVVGHPAMDALLGYRSTASRDTRTAIEQAFGRDYAVFAGEPFNQALASGGELEARGYTEREVLARVVAALERIAADRGRPVALVIKPHPRCPDATYADVIASLAPRGVALHVSNLSALDLAAHAQLVVGMTSMLLYEAVAMGTPVVSVQPNRRRGSDVTDGRPGIVVVTDTRDLDAAVARQYGACLPPASRPAPAGSVARFLDALGLGAGVPLGT